MTVLGVGVLGGATVLAANLFPDQTYTLWQAMKGWGGNSHPSVEQVAITLQSTSSPAESPIKHFVLLPRVENGTVLRLCSRRGPKVDGGWNATQGHVANLESNLKRITSLRSAGSLKGMSIAHPENCYRQYIPIVVAGRKLIYVNAFCGIEVPEWRTQFVTICDGGDSVWGVLYDPTTGEFSDLEVNGLA